MTLLRNGKSSDSLVAGKLEQSLNYLKERYSDRPFNFTSYWQRENQYATKVRVKYKVDNVREENDSVVMDVEVLEVVFTDGQNRITSRELPEETENLKKEIEQNLSIIISSEAPQNLKDYLRKKLVLNTDFNF
jgi:predicted RNA-binding protein with PIN domain